MVETRRMVERWGYCDLYPCICFRTPRHIPSEQIDNNTERAVLIPVWDNLVHLNPEAANGVVSHCFQWKFHNCGKTPAFIRELYGGLLLVDSLDDLPNKPIYEKASLFHGDPLMPNKDAERMFYSPLGDPRPYHVVEDDIRLQGKVLFAYGFVRYDDMFGRKHETRFGLRYKANKTFSPRQDEFILAGPKTYNKYT